MATSKPRITVTLTYRQHEVLRTISECGGSSMSTVIAELLEVSLPTLERMAATFQQLRKATEIERSKVVEAMADAQSALEPLALAAAGQFDLFLGKLEGAAAPALSVAGTAAAAPLSPSTNRGDTPHAGKGLEGSSGKGLKGVLKKQVLKKSGVCTCVITEHERQENKACPVHFPKGRKNAV